MSDVELHMAPGTCARVSCIALEETGEDFETVVVRFMKGEHKSPGFKKLNPKGKVPTLVFDGEPLTENVAIITFLNQRYPDARLMPEPKDELDALRQLADLCFCSTTLHPIVTRIRMSSFIAGPDCANTVWSAACDAMVEYFELIERRLANQDWWYGDSWSAMDAYLYWVFWRVEGAEFDVAPFPRYSDHARRMESRPAVQRALAREAEAVKILEAEGLNFVPPSPTG
ncbi:MAG: glutathione S-transferase family protein [Woeseiaceae bacterium]|jgi:glutathione S-transferase